MGKCRIVAVDPRKSLKMHTLLILADLKCNKLMTWTLQRVTAMHVDKTDESKDSVVL